MRLNTISDKSGARRKAKRVGRGIGSGLGKTAGRGVKGQTSRSGVSINGFEGGQMPIYRRLPKRGFNKPNRLDWNEINLGRLQAAIDAKKIDAKKPIDLAVMVEAGLFSRTRDGVRLLGKGELKTKVNLVIDHATKAAAEAVEKAGGSIKLVERKAKPAEDAEAKTAKE
jgi:large subunit ribosomal protein L15